MNSVAPPITVNVRAQIDPEWPANVTGATFDLVRLQTGTTEELLEKEILFYVRDRLLRKDLVFSERFPALLVAISSYIGPYEEYVPPSTFYFPMPTNTTTTTNAGHTATSTVQGAQYVPVHREGYARVRYHRSITLFVGQPKADSSGVVPVWQGTVESDGEIADLMAVVPTMVRHLLTEFPRRSGYPPQRTVALIGATDPQ
jgi:hypothetical protein